MTAKQFFTNPITIIVGSLIIIGGGLWLGKKYLGWFPENPERKQINCTSNDDCTDPGTHCGQEGMCVYDLNSEQGEDVYFNISPRRKLFVKIPTSPTTNPDGGPRPTPQA